MVVLVGGAVLFALVSWLVVTDKQRIEELIDRGIEALQEQQDESCLALLDDTCELSDGGHLTAVSREDFRPVLRHLAQAFSSLKIEKQKLKVVVSEDTARAAFQIMVELTSRDIGPGPLCQLRGVLALRRVEPKVWKVSRIELIEKRSGFR